MQTLTRTAFAVSALALIAACSSGLDWRELQWPEGGFAVLLPGRPSKETRPVTIGARTLNLTVLPVRVEPFVFGVGYADLPASLDHAAREQLVIDARDSLLANMSAKATTERSTPLDGFPCREFEAQGSAEQRTFAMAARVCATDRRYLQLVSLAPQPRAGELDSAVFLGSLKLLKP
jgi:hypothetical protein